MPSNATTMFDYARFKPFTIAVFAALIAATWLDWYWPWGLLFIYWAIPGILSGEAFLVERILRARNPILFWLITGMWVVFGVWTIYADIAWRMA